MGLITKNVDEPGFHATVHTLTCDQTGKKLADIIVKEKNEDLIAMVRATSPFIENGDSGWHKITGLLAFGGIESPRFPTIVDNIEYEEKDEMMFATLKVING
jgi:hypothetical protein